MGFPANPINSAQLERNLQLPLLIEVSNNWPTIIFIPDLFRSLGSVRVRISAMGWKAVIRSSRLYDASAPVRTFKGDRDKGENKRLVLLAEQSLVSFPFEGELVIALTRAAVSDRGFL
jgi:hypothetical protein